MATPKRELLLICGIPGTGKTEYGKAFARQFGFAHYDLEERQIVERLLADPTQFIADILDRDASAVVTWGFMPIHPPSVSAVLQFRASGFKLVWFDGNRQAALRTFQDRAKAKSRSDAEFYFRMHEFYLQMYRIETTKIIETIKPAVINSFDADEEFKTPASLLEEIRNF